MDWLDSLEARNRAQAKYDKEHTKGVYMKLNLRTDMDIIRWMWAQNSVQGSIKRLIREDICRKNGCPCTFKGFRFFYVIKCQIQEYNTPAAALSKKKAWR